MTTAQDTTVIPTDLEAFVWLGFHRDTSTEFRVTLPSDRDQAKRLIETVGCYNRFDPAEAWEIIDGWREAMMHVDLAREGSVALYFRFPWTERQILSRRGTIGPMFTDGIRISTEQVEQWVEHLTRDLTDSGADETSYNPTTRVLRAWWD